MNNKKVTENHNVVTENDESNFDFEDMAGISKPDEIPDNEETKADEASDNKTSVKKPKTKKGADKTENIVILKKAATYSGCGLRFVKNVPTPVKDKAVYSRLLSTGLFVKGK